MTAPTSEMLPLAAMFSDVAPAVLFLAYQKSLTAPLLASTDLALPAAVYVFPTLSVMLLIAALMLPTSICQPTTIKLPFPVAGMLQVDAGNTNGPQVVARTRLICAQAGAASKSRPAVNATKGNLRNAEALLKPGTVDISATIMASFFAWRYVQQMARLSTSIIDLDGIKL